eukprot:CAMPEP_0202701618 /NCGR_PEP_ID=MMETSP1385-20130828/14695_1 /ASSEMBLY_ACC=CAM_ASM_000861 /TAXON_ID=933848 /ORGANISM="Elphidium margaritaceum" /LENGTH=340 /DNA_ID=CAMNT_0049359073 /DNA_START=56 /DNA_END=1078 /DNA_ORIENTATION=-
MRTSFSSTPINKNASPFSSTSDAAALSDLDDIPPNLDFNIPSTYDWHETSANNYSRKYEPVDFVDYEYSKSLLDYTYHGYYSTHRQIHVHNPIIAYYKSIAMHKLQTPDYMRDHPWMLFTAGPMGAGKTHMLKWLAVLDVFPLQAFLKISPDRIKRFLPEYTKYLKTDEKNVGSMLRTEVGYLCEIIIWELLSSSHVSIWMDSSLRHGSFFEGMFKNINMRFPAYKIALLNVVCDPSTVFERAIQRTQITGRHVPESDIQQSIDEVPRSVQTLSTLADVVIHIDNSFDSNLQSTPNVLQLQCNDRQRNNKPVVVDKPSWTMLNDIWNGKLSQQITQHSKL